MIGKTQFNSDIDREIDRDSKLENEMGSWQIYGKWIGLKKDKKSDRNKSSDSYRNRYEIVKVIRKAKWDRDRDRKMEMFKIGIAIME